ncbi:Imm10 family immunity protein [Actinokineospora sp. UTMC 2448]|uniref:Imm10 family immunity protein n=1 Tax=Actinokineospora sp. UTMC 2448 TaxID=2268449 RepID=UPI0021648A34|nr:Imm10 family immunity protein [Actinokineospora sp. UTMC 2448]UVS80417.1 hypothetical protein Actkin_04168 [Actinokineospora sp. UTMC 2448]
MEMIIRSAALDHDEYGVLTAGLAENADGTGRCLLFQASLLAFDDQDIANGEDRYCVMTDTGATEYGGVLRALHEGDTLSIALTPHLAAVLALDEDVTCRFEGIDRTAVREFADGLRAVLAIAPEGDRPSVEVV